MAILPDIFSFAVARNFKNHIFWCEFDHMFVLSYVLVEMPNATYLPGLDVFCVSNKEVTLCQ